MCPVERKIIEDVAKEAGLAEEDIPAAVDMEMRMKLAQGTREQSDMMASERNSILHFRSKNKNKSIFYNNATFFGIDGKFQEVGKE